MNKLRLEIREDAYIDLDNIWVYTFEEWSINQADKYYNEIIVSMESLCSNPDLGKSADYLRLGYKVLKVNLHLIFYIVTETEIEVIRILHSKMDIPNRILD